MANGCCFQEDFDGNLPQQEGSALCLLVDALTLAWDEMEFESFYTNQTSKQLVQQPNITARWASKKKTKHSPFGVWIYPLGSESCLTL